MDVDVSRVGGGGGSWVSAAVAASDSAQYLHDERNDDVDMGYEDHVPSAALRRLQQQQQTFVRATSTPPPQETSASAASSAAAADRSNGASSPSTATLPSMNTSSTSSRRGSMSAREQQERRANIKAILANANISPLSKRRSIQHLMDGRSSNRRRHSFSSSSIINDNNANENETLDVSMEQQQQQQRARRRSSCNNSISTTTRRLIPISSSSSELIITPASLSDSDGDCNSHQHHLLMVQQQQQEEEEEEENRRACAVSEDESSSPNARHPQHVHSSHSNKKNSNMSWENLKGTTGSGGVRSNNNAATRRAEETRPPCPHYKRNCTLIAPCCGAAFGCRICHDDCPVLPAKLPDDGEGQGGGDDAKKATVSRQRHGRYPRSASMPSCSITSSATSATTTSSYSNTTSTDDDDDSSDHQHLAHYHPEDTHHNIDRFAIKEVICRECYTRQSSKTNNCIHCGIQFGEYHCIICNLWMSADESPYHCHECGFCRVGGAHNFQHCADCGMCIDKSLYDNHNCKSGKYKSNCPVCQEYLFSSRSASHEMPCGHAIHWDCFRQLAAHDSRCPVCKKTAETKDRMMPAWRAMAAGIAMQPLPLELARVVDITCNDCEESHMGRAWHFLGVQCHSCSSFNTVVDRLVSSGEEAHRYLQANNQLLPAAPLPLPPLPLPAPSTLIHANAAARSSSSRNNHGVTTVAVAAAATSRRTSPEGGETHPRPRRRQRRVNRRRSLL